MILRGGVWITAYYHALDTETPAGLTVYFQAAANNKMIITSDTVTTEGYLSSGRGALCQRNVEDWKNTIRYYLTHLEEASICASKFKSYLETEYSAEKYAKTLWRMLTEWRTDMKRLMD